MPIFSYSNEPESLKPKHQRKFRTDDIGLLTDKRVIKGNTYSSHFQKSGDRLLASYRTKNTSMIQSSTKQSTLQIPRPMYNYIVENREDLFDVSRYLFDHEDLIIPEVLLASTQTDELIPRPFVPYIPEKLGNDAETQVEDSELDMLFVFDNEVKPLLEVLVTKTIEQAIFEIKSEDEMIEIDRQTLLYIEEKQEEENRIKELEGKLSEERVRNAQIMKDRIVTIQEQKELYKKVGAYLFARQVTHTMSSNIIDDLLENKWRYRVTAPAEEFLVIVYKEVELQAQARQHALDELHDILQSQGLGLKNII